MATQYRCDSERRRQLVSESTTINGIDYLTVDPDEMTLRVHFLHDLPGTGSGAIPPAPAPALTAAEVAIDGGVRFPDIRVVAVSSSGSELTVTVDRPGDYSDYSLRLHTPIGDLPAIFARIHERGLKVAMATNNARVPSCAEIGS